MNTFFMQESAFMNEKVELIKTYKSGKVIFEAYLQEADIPNDNHRLYMKEDLQQGLSNIQPRIQKRQFVGELDHPISNDPIRQTTVLYKETSHIIAECGWEGNLLKAGIETCPYTSNGKALSGFVMDHVAVGFSLRGLADVQDQGDHRLIRGPIMIITYDSVSKPSNKKALFTQLRHESLNILHESSNVICTSDGVCYLPNYFDMLVEQKIIKIQKKYWAK